jgi:hypothetical protein
MENKKTSWPLPVTMQEALGDQYKTIILGWLVELEAMLKRSVIWVSCPTDPQALPTSDDIVYIKYHYNHQSSKLCVGLREFRCADCDKDLKASFCDSSDMNAADYLFSQKTNRVVPKDQPHDWLVEDDGRRYTYLCTLTGLREWILPFYIGDEMVGAFITGQFYDKKSTKTAEEIAEGYLTALEVEKLPEELLGKIELWLEEERNANGRDTVPLPAMFIRMQEMQKTTMEWYEYRQSDYQNQFECELLDILADKDS